MEGPAGCCLVFKGFGPLNPAAIELPQVLEACGSSKGQEPSASAMSAETDAGPLSVSLELLSISRGPSDESSGGRGAVLEYLDCAWCRKDHWLNNLKTL